MRAPAQLRHGCLEEELPVDAIFVVAVVALYAVTHWIVRALSRLGGVE
jgi:hypothetical protein